MYAFRPADCKIWKQSNAAHSGSSNRSHQDEYLEANRPELQPQRYYHPQRRSPKIRSTISKVPVTNTKQSPEQVIFGEAAIFLSAGAEEISAFAEVGR